MGARKQTGEWTKKWTEKWTEKWTRKCEPEFCGLGGADDEKCKH